MPQVTRSLPPWEMQTMIWMCSAKKISSPPGSDSFRASGHQTKMQLRLRIATKVSWAIMIGTLRSSYHLLMTSHQFLRRRYPWGRASLVLKLGTSLGLKVLSMTRFRATKMIVLCWISALHNLKLRYRRTYSCLRRKTNHSPLHYIFLQNGPLQS